MPVGKGLGFLVADEQREIPVFADDARALLDTLRRLIMDRLRKLDDGPGRKQFQHAFAKILVRAPDVAEIAAAMDEDRPARHRPLKLPGREIIEPRDIGRPLAVAGGEIGHLAQPDRRIAAIADVREVEDGQWLPGRNVVLEAVVDGGLEPCDQRQPGLRFHRLFLHSIATEACPQAGRSFARTLPRMRCTSVSGPCGRPVSSHKRKVAAQ